VNTRRGIRWHLFQVQLVSIVPIGLFAAAMLYLHWQVQENERERSQMESVRLIAAAVDNALDSTAERLSIFARLWSSTDLSEEAIYGQAKEALSANADWRNIVAFGADGKRVLSASRDREIHVWETAEAKKLTEITGFEGDVLKVIASSKQIFSASTDRRVRQHSLDGKRTELVRMFSGHEDFVYALAYYGASGRLASGSFDGEVRLWDTSSGQLVTNFLAAPGLGQIRIKNSK
jgi:WD40 repeat protein